MWWAFVAGGKLGVYRAIYIEFVGINKFLITKNNSEQIIKYALINFNLKLKIKNMLQLFEF